MKNKTANEPSWRGNSGPISRWMYLAPVILVVVGGAAFGYFLYASLSSLSASLTQTMAPGTTEVTLARPGVYTVFHEYESEFDGKVYSVPQALPDLECGLVSSSTGKTVTLERPAGKKRYSIIGRAGVSLYEFIIKQPGAYQFSCEYIDGKQGPDTIISVGAAFFGDLVKAIFIGFLILGLSSFTGIVAFVAIYLQRREALKKGGAAG